MPLRDRMYLLSSPADVDEFLAEFPTSALFKAGRCHKTNLGFRQLEKALDARESIFLGFIRAIDDQAAADHVAMHTGIPHQAPQVILFAQGKPVFTSDHWHITEPTLAFALRRHCGPLPGEDPTPAFLPNEVTEYRHLLQALLDDQLTDEAFARQWKELPRSHTHLQSLLREMDEALCCGDRCSDGGCSSLPIAQRKRATLKAKATQLLSLFNF
jgi:bacillithiol system protein YtxJ